MKIDAKAVIAFVVVVGGFGLLGIYVYRNETPEAVVVAVISGALNLILGFYFGHLNGSVTALANSSAALNAQATQILGLAQQRRATDPPSSTPTTPVGGGIPTT